MQVMKKLLYIVAMLSPIVASAETLELMKICLI